MDEKSDQFLRFSAATDPHERQRAETQQVITNSITRTPSSIIWHITTALIDSSCGKMICLVTCSDLSYPKPQDLALGSRGRSLRSLERIPSEEKSQLLHDEATKTRALVLSSIVCGRDMPLASVVDVLARSYLLRSR